MRLVIAEDEHLERKAMKKFIQNHFPEIHVIEEAVNGREAIELAKKLHPHIMLMDIKMPGINGLEAIEQIYTMNPTVKFILVSAYDTFEYAKTAMKYGIKDYILKPSKKEEIKAAILRVKKEIENEAKSDEMTLQTIQLLRESFITKVMQHPVHPSASELYKQLYPDANAGFFLVCVSEHTYEKQTLQEIFKKHMYFEHIIYQANDRIVVCVLADEYVGKAEQLHLTRKVSIEFGRSMYIGIGNSQHSVKDFPTSYREAYSACLQLKNDGKVNYGFVQHNEYHKATNELIDVTIDYMEKGNLELLIMFFEQNSHQLTEMDKENLFIRIQNTLQQKNINIPKRSINSLQTDSHWVAYLEVCCLKFKEFHQSVQSIEKAKTYIISNFAKSISLEEVAELVNLSPNYFSNLFKETKGETFIDFVTRIRMEHAKKLLEENEHTLKEISYKVGYKDPNYFSRVFKRNFGVSPKHYQKEIFK